MFKDKKRELVVQSNGKEFVLPLTKSSGAFGGRLNFISARELSEKCYMLVMRAGEAREMGSPRKLNSSQSASRTC